MKCVYIPALSSSPLSLLMSVFSHLSFRSGSTGAARKLPPLPGPDPLVVLWTLPHWAGQVRHRIPRIIPYIQRHPPLGKNMS